MIDFPDGTLRREQDLCREKLDAAGRRHADELSAEKRAEYLRILKAFTKLVMNGRAPADHGVGYLCRLSA